MSDKNLSSGLWGLRPLFFRKNPYKGITLSSGALEFLKWLAVILMTADHINKYLFHESSQLVFSLGRIAFPLFSFTLAYSLANATTATIKRVAWRLLLFGTLAEIPYFALGNLLWGWWPLNIMFLLLISSIVILLSRAPSRRNEFLSILLIAAGGAVVEFWWFGIWMTVAAYQYSRKPSKMTLWNWLASITVLTLANLGNPCALLVVPLIFMIASSRLSIPRVKHVLYWYYPLHLAVLATIAIAIR